MSATCHSAARAVAVIVLGLLLPSCWMLAWNPGQPIPTYLGVEDPSLRTRAHGTLVWLDPYDDDRLGVLDIATGARGSVEIDAEPIAFSGPDEKGRIALLQPNSWWRSNHRLAVVSMSGGDVRTLLEGDRELSRSSTLAIAPRGGRVAVLRSFDLGGYRSSAPELLVVDVDKGTVTMPPVEAPDSTTPRWYPDGMRFAYVEAAPEPLEGETWVLDVASGARTRLCGGCITALSTDGSLALVRFANQIDLVDATSGAIVRPGALSPLPACDRGVIALFEPYLVLHHGAPPVGEEQELVGTFGVAGSARYPIRLTDLAVDRSTIVLPRTWHWRTSFSGFDCAALAAGAQR